MSRTPVLWSADRASQEFLSQFGPKLHEALARFCIRLQLQIEKLEARRVRFIVLGRAEDDEVRGYVLDDLMATPSREFDASAPEMSELVETSFDHYRMNGEIPFVVNFVGYEHARPKIARFLFRRPPYPWLPQQSQQSPQSPESPEDDIDALLDGVTPLPLGRSTPIPVVPATAAALSRDPVAAFFEGIRTGNLSDRVFSDFVNAAMAQGQARVTTTRKWSTTTTTTMSSSETIVTPTAVYRSVTAPPVTTTTRAGGKF